MAVSQEEAVQLVNEIIESDIEKYVNEFIIPEMQSVSRAANLPDEFIDGIKFRRTENQGGEIINTWGDNDTPLSKYFEEGTPDHDIWSKGPWPLHWKGLLGQEIYVSTKNKPVHVRGIPRSRAMMIGLELGKKRIIQEVPKAIEEQL